MLVITDPWQLPRAAHAFARKGLSVIPLAAEPSLDPAARNRLASPCATLKLFMTRLAKGHISILSALRPHAQADRRSRYPRT